MAKDVRFGKFRYDADAGVLYRQAELVQLPPRALAVLGCLIAAGGDLVTKSKILETAWPDSYVAEDSLTHAISVLRGALGDDPKNPDYIQTVPRRGYRFVASLPGASGSEAEGNSAAKDSGGSWRWWRLAGGVGLALTAATVWMTSSGGLGPAPAAGYERIGRLALTLEVRESDRLDAAATRELLADRIERDTRLVVVEPDDDPDATLRVVFEHVDDRLRVAARVRGAPDGANWWGQDWDLPVAMYTDTDFARSLLSRLQFLLDLTSEYSTLRGSTSREAMLLGVQAGDLLLGAAQRDLHRAEEAANVLRRALDLDPDFARARAGRVAIRAEAADWRPWTAEELALAEQDIAAALAGDPDDPVVHIARALLARLQGDLGQMRASLDEAETYGPSIFWIYMIRAELEHAMGFDDLALATARRGVSLDPYLPSMLGRLIDVQLWRADLAAAALTLDTLTALDAEGYWSGRSRARLLQARGDFAGAEAALLLLRERWANALWIHQELASFYTARGNAAAAEAATARLQALVRE